MLHIDTNYYKRTFESISSRIQPYKHLIPISTGDSAQENSLFDVLNDKLRLCGTLKAANGGKEHALMQKLMDEIMDLG